MSLKDKGRNELHYGLKTKRIIYNEIDVKEEVLELQRRHDEFYADCTKMGDYPPIDEWIKDIFGDFEK